MIILFCFILASCATRDPSNLTYGKRDVGIDAAFILPADRSVIGITQERASNGITQTIALSTNSSHSGENFFRVTFFGPVNAEGASENTLSYSQLTESRITRELRTEMAGVAITRSPYYVQNNYGPFSYATGTTSGGDSCIYAWQQIRAPAHTQNFFQNRGRIDLRLRLCETGTSQEKLLATMYEFTINATIGVSSWNPLGEPAGPSPELGRPGNPLLAPSVNSNMSGPFPASDLNTDRLNTTLQSTDSSAVSRSVLPAPKRSAINQPAQMPDDYSPVTQPYAVHTYPQSPVTVPAPQQINSAVTSVNHLPQPLQVLSPTMAQVQTAAPLFVPAPVQGQVMNPPAVVVPSPCRLATNPSSGVTVGNNSTVCP
ncbi:hypothetical protein FHS77_002837 [Paenochrobactrum gallinarii]|uniref:Cellulose biosynthesis protein BcsN n=1 Tax=Paenochrobactrum gallinarii TaxID=643673 RepID=A0A841LV90_9HYPH|nr:cellulose biosynthesis protein BcsN [Paenochrobactrum gallinarii]MBB6262265.1 hypothetical protein [Paenochrobactrum gallinarii]